MNGKQENMRELEREEMSKVNAGAEAATASTENGTPNLINPVGPVPVPEDDTGFGTKCKCGHCGYIINSYDAAGKYYFDCPNCKQKANWIFISFQLSQ